MDFSLKVEKILKGILDLIPSPSTSVKIQSKGGKVSLRCKGKTLPSVVNKSFGPKSFAKKEIEKQKMQMFTTTRR